MPVNETLINVPGRLHSVASEHHLGGANEIYDDDLNRLQSNINAEALTNVIPILYDDLVELRDNNGLIPGKMYRITDYVTTTSQEYTRSAGHQFDIIVIALTPNTLCEQASAALHEGDEYFADAPLASWKLLYSLDNNRDIYGWAMGNKSFYIRTNYNMVFYRNPELDDLEAEHPYAWTAEQPGESGSTFYSDVDENNISVGDLLYHNVGGTRIVSEINLPKGKGVIYRMVDEHNIDCDYDFKNIQYLCYVNRWNNSKFKVSAEAYRTALFLYSSVPTAKQYTDYVYKPNVNAWSSSEDISGIQYMFAKSGILIYNSTKEVNPLSSYKYDYQGNEIDFSYYFKENEDYLYIIRENTQVAYIDYFAWCYTINGKGTNTASSFYNINENDGVDVSLINKKMFNVRITSFHDNTANSKNLLLLPYVIFVSSTKTPYLKYNRANNINVENCNKLVLGSYRANNCVSTDVYLKYVNNSYLLGHIKNYDCSYCNNIKNLSNSTSVVLKDVYNLYDNQTTVSSNTSGLIDNSYVKYCTIGLILGGKGNFIEGCSGEFYGNSIKAIHSSAIINSNGAYLFYSTVNCKGNNCTKIKIINSKQVNINKDYIQDIIVENCEYLNITSNQTTSSSNIIKNIEFKNIKGLYNNYKEISHDTVNDTFLTTYKPVNSKIISV